MGTRINDVASSVQGLTLGDDLYSARNQLVFPQEDIQGLDRLVSTITTRAQLVKALVNDVNNSVNPPAGEVCSLYKQIKKLTEITFSLRTTIDDLAESTESSIVRRLTSLGNQRAAVATRNSSIKELISYFMSTIKDIVREVLGGTNDQDVLWRAAEACYEQAIRPDGILCADDYFHPLEEACLAWPYDPDFDSERYYEHENQLLVDEDYAAAFREQRDQESEEHQHKRQSWVDFWIGALHNAPNGPTLFYPPLSLHRESFDLDVPRYLFRTFDAVSSGRNDENVVASIVNRNGAQESNRTDILSREKQDGAEMLYMHLKKNCFGGAGQDNLMSWTSSLLYAIQYAVWRAHIRGRHPSEISICAIDTSKFPLGQFVRDIPLLEAYREAAEQLGGSLLEFFDFRLRTSDYYNGEYLSQGAVNHSGRSCMMSLERLIQAGLFQLYPEFDDAEGRKKWAKRVRELRHLWSTEQDTSEQEIQIALKVARDCFAQLEPVHLASMLLSFKQRKYSELDSPGECFVLRMTILMFVASISDSFSSRQSMATRMGKQAGGSLSILDY
jgi:hypothetical protein